MWSSVATMYQLGLVAHAGVVFLPPADATFQGIYESAKNRPSLGLTSPAKAAGNFARSTIR